MSDVTEFLIQHGYALLFFWVLAESAGVPVPATPLLVTAGALVARGHLSITATAAVAIVAVMLSDTLWYALGRRYGTGVLHLLCKISLEADSCLRRTRLAFEKRGSKAVAFAKFVPGLNVMTAPMAGVARMPVQQFLVFDAIGAFLWSSAFISIGFAFSEQLDRVLKSLEIVGTGLIVLVLVALLSYVSWKWARRRRLVNELRMARINPEELKANLDSGEDVIVVDLRDELEIASEPHTIPGAIRLKPGELDQLVEFIPHKSQIALFCSCPDEATAAKVAHRLQSRGFTRIRPLAGGLARWRQLGFPLEPIMDAAQDASRPRNGASAGSSPAAVR